MKTFISFLVLFTSLTTFAKDASIVLMRGEIFVNGKQTEKKIDLVYGDKVEARGEGSFVQILFNTGSKLMLKDGIILLERFKKEGSTINMIKGTIFTYVNKAAKKEFRVKTRHSSMAVRGTKFFVEEKEDETYLCVCEGVVRIQNKTGHRDIKRGQDIHATKKGALSITKASDMMWKMSIEAFKQMDLPLENPPR
jgi:ferric-dicitrate binding protein FerR (iron transport regulator)